MQEIRPSCIKLIHSFPCNEGPFKNMFQLLNIGCVVLVLNQTNTDVCMYIEEFILVDIWIHCCTKLKNEKLKVFYTGLYTKATIEEKG